MFEYHSIAFITEFKSIFQQKDAVWNAYHSWELSGSAVRVMIPSPNGIYLMDGSFTELHDDVIELDDIVTRISDSDNEAYQISDLPRYPYCILKKSLW